MTTVGEGEHLVVRVHGRPVAELVPHLETCPTWRPLAELATLFPGVDDPAWDQDVAAVDGATVDPFERGSDR